jgi:hypothetical protein
MTEAQAIAQINELIAKLGWFALGRYDMIATPLTFETFIWSDSTEGTDWVRVKQPVTLTRLLEPEEVEEFLAATPGDHTRERMMNYYEAVID